MPIHFKKIKTHAKQTKHPKMDKLLKWKDWNHSYRHRKIINLHRQRGDLNKEYQWVLIDHTTGERFHTIIMDHLKAFYKNQELKGSGMSWNRMGY